MPQVRQEEEKRVYVVSLYDHAPAQESLSRGYEIYNFGRLFLSHHYSALSLSESCLRVEKKIFKEIMHFYFMKYNHAPAQKNLFPGDHEIYNFGRPFLSHDYYILSLSDLVCSLSPLLRIFHSHRDVTL